MRKLLNLLAISVVLLYILSSCDQDQADRDDVPQQELPVVQPTSPVDEEPPVEQVRPDFAMGEMMAQLSPSLSKQEVIKLLGAPYHRLTYTKVIEPGRSLPWEVWRYDFGATEYYSYRPPEGMGITYPDLNNLEAAKLTGQLFIDWGAEEEDVPIYTLFFHGEDGRIHSEIMKDGNVYSSQNNEWAIDADIKLGDQVRLYRNVTAIPHPIESGENQYAFSLKASQNYEVMMISDVSIQIRSSDGAQGWVPTWYVMPQSKEVIQVPPTRMRLQDNAEAALWPSAAPIDQLMQGQEVYVYEAYEDWVGVHPAGKALTYSALLWVDEKALQPSTPFEPFYASSQLNPIDVSNAVQSIIQSGDSQKRMREIFGEPTWVDDSKTITMQSYPAETTEVWRYESNDSMLYIAWSEEVDVDRFQFRLKDSSGTEFVYPENSWDLRFDELFAPSTEFPLVWRHQNDLAHNFLVGKVGDVLIIRGDDGNISGYHDHSNLYGLDANTGEKLWQIDAGYAGIEYVIEDDVIAVLTRLDVVSMKYHTKLQAINPTTGKVIWSKEWPEESGFWHHLSTVKGGVVAVTQANDDDKFSNIEVLDIRSGRVRWNQNFAANEWVLPVSRPSPVVLIASDEGITAYGVADGKQVWTLQGHTVALYNPVTFTHADSRHFIARPPVIWLQLEDAHVKLDLQNGNKLAEIAVKENIRIVELDERYIFIQESLDDNAQRFSQWEQVRTSLFDLIVDRVLWTMDGTGNGGFIEDDRIYFKLNGIPTAAMLESGEMLWQPTAFVDAADDSQYGLFSWGRPIVGKFNILLPTVNSLYIVDRETGVLQHRVNRVRFGYTGHFRIENLHGQLTDLDGALYVGSSNGYFSRLVWPDE